MGETTIVSESGDGYIWNGDSTWSAARDAASGDAIYLTSTGVSQGIGNAMGAGPTYYLYRSWFVFDLSTVTSEITAASLYIRGVVFAESTICMQEGTQSIPLLISEFQAFTGNSLGSVVWSATDNTITFNADGLTYLNSVRGSNAKICLRDYTYDFLDSPTTTRHANGVYFSESSTPAWRPQLTVTYSDVPVYKPIFYVI
jgi:hypothetical protein